MTIIGSAHVHIRADDKYFEADVRKATAKIKNVTIQLKADVDMAKASKKIRDLRYRITSKDAVLKVDANVAKAEEKMSKLLAKFMNKDVEFNAKANTAEANSALSDLTARYASKRVPFTAQADTRAADRALAALSRARTTTFSAHIDPSTQRALNGLFNTITGTISAEKIKGVLVGLAANFEGLAIKATMALTAITAVSGVALVAGGNLLSLGGDLTEVIGVAGLFPAAMFAVITTIKATTMAWKGFGAAVTEEDPKKAAEALAKLPPEAQKAAEALRKLRGEVQKPVQRAFWAEMGTSLQDMYQKKVPEFARGMSTISAAMGRFTREALESITNTGDMKSSFDAVGETIDNLAKGLEPAIVSLERWIGVGSTYLPRFGTWVSDLATKFGAWTEEAERTGKMNIWIETGIQRIQELGSMVKSTAGIFSGLTTAARAAGAPGMTELAASLREIRDTVNGEPFQSRLIIVLEGARSGVEKLGTGFRNLAEFVGESSVTLGLFLDRAGEIAGLTFDNIRILFDGTGLGSGLDSAMKGLEDLLRDIKPGVEDLGAAMGILGNIAGEVLRNLGPGLNQLFETVRGILERVEEGVLKVIPIFNEFIQAVLATVQGPLYALAEIVGNLLESFAGLPGPIQTVIMSLGLFALAFSKIFGAIDGFKDKLTKTMADADSRVGQNLRNIQDGAQTMRGAFTRETDAMKEHGIRSFAGFGTSVRQTFDATSAGMKWSMTSAFDAMPPRAQRAVTGIKGAFSTLATGFFGTHGLGSFARELEPVRVGLASIPDNARTAASKVSDSFRSMFSRVGEFVAPAGGAIRNFANEVHGNLGPARNAFDNMADHARTATLNAATQVSAGLRSIGSGVSGFFGGPVGLAIMAATILYGEFATQQAKIKEQQDAFASAFEASGGRIDSAVRKVIQSNLDMKKSFFGMEFDSTFDIAKRVGIPLRDVVDASAGVPGAMKKVQTALGQTGDAATKFGSAVNFSLNILKDTGGPLRGIADWIDKTGLFRSEGDKLNDQIIEQKRLMEAQQREYEETAKSLGIGTVAAKRMAENYDVLRDAASSVSSRVEALKDNIDLQNQSFLTSRNAARDHAKNMFDLDAAMKSLPGAMEGVIDGTGRMNDAFRNTLTDADGTFNNLSQQSIAFSEEMDAAATSILNVGMAEMKKLQDAGAELPAAQVGAMKVMGEQTEALRAKLAILGFDAGQQQVILNQLGLNPEKLMGALVVDTKAAEAEVMRFEVFKEAVMNKNWEVALEASTDDVKNAILTTEEYKKAYQEGGWEAVVKLKDQTGKGFGDLMAKITLAKAEGKDITSYLRAEFPDAEVFDAAMKVADTWEATESKATLGIEDQTRGIPDAVKTKVEELDGKVANTTVKATDEASGVVDGATGKIGGWNIFEAVQKDLKARDATGPTVLLAQGTMEQLKAVERDLTAKNAAGKGTAESQATLDSLRGVIRDLEGKNMADPGMQAAQRTINTFKGKEVELTAEDKASAVVEGVNKKALNNKSFSITAVIDGLSAAARSILGLYNGGIIGGSGIQQFADGGIQMPAVKQFANGGIQMPQMKSYAKGGVENHVAQIARGAWPVRVWAEPETGGEAYLPLGKHKRKRSLAILDEVAEMFGYSLVKRMEFADGGIMKMAKTPSVVTNSSVTQQTIMAAPTSASAPTVITNVYPSAPLNERQVADSVSENIYWKLSTLP